MMPMFSAAESCQARMTGVALSITTSPPSTMPDVHGSHEPATLRPRSARWGPPGDGRPLLDGQITRVVAVHDADHAVARDRTAGRARRTPPRSPLPDVGVEVQHLHTGRFRVEIVARLDFVGPAGASHVDRQRLVQRDRQIVDERVVARAENGLARIARRPVRIFVDPCPGIARHCVPPISELAHHRRHQRIAAVIIRRSELRRSGAL